MHNVEILSYKACTCNVMLACKSYRLHDASSKWLAVASFGRHLQNSNRHIYKYEGGVKCGSHSTSYCHILVTVQSDFRYFSRGNNLHENTSNCDTR